VACVTPILRWQHTNFMAALTLLLAAPLAAQSSPARAEPTTGPVIISAGVSLVVENPTFTVPDDHQFKVVFMVNSGGGDTVRVNGQMTSLARFYNLHARNGIPASRVSTAAVIFGGGWPSVLTDSAFAARFGGKPNPSRALVEELLKQGAILVLCGQTAESAGVRREELIPGVTVAISAMTALNGLYERGYRLNPW